MAAALTFATLAVAAGAALALHAGSRWLGPIHLLASAAVAVVVFVHLLPEALALSGVWGAAWAALGFLVPQAAHRLAHADHDHRVALTIAWLGLVLHAVGDGIGLALFSQGIDHHHGHDHDDVVFVLALHRLPVSAFVAAEVSRRAGVGAAWAAAGGLALATLLGALGAGTVDVTWIDTSLGPITGLTTGVLLHVIAHRPHEHSHAHDPPAA